MKEIVLDCWEELSEEIEKATQKLDSMSGTKGRSERYFRGHANSEWKLETTLERAGFKDVTFQNYDDLILRIYPQIANLCKQEKCLFELQTKPYPFSHQSWPLLKNLDLCIFLRHHGFPSPLLDWTFNYWVALYFAFSEKQITTPEFASIFMYCNRTRNATGHWTGLPRVEECKSENCQIIRNSRQAATYTTCQTLDKQTYYFKSHEYLKDVKLMGQEHLYCFKIPYENRLNVLKHLYEKNITDYSMFGDSDSFVSTIAKKELELRGL